MLTRFQAHMFVECSQQLLHVPIIQYKHPVELKSMPQFLIAFHRSGNDVLHLDIA